MPKDYDYLLKVLLVGDSDVGKHEIMAGLEDASSESPFCSRSGNCKFVILLLRLTLWFFFLDENKQTNEQTKGLNTMLTKMRFFFGQNSLT